MHSHGIANFNRPCPGKGFRENFSGRILYESERIFLKVRVFGENSGGLFGTRQACRDLLGRNWRGIRREFFAIEKSWGEFWRKTFPRTWSVEVCNNRVARALSAPPAQCPRPPPCKVPIVGATNGKESLTLHHQIRKYGTVK